MPQADVRGLSGVSGAEADPRAAWLARVLGIAGSARQSKPTGPAAPPLSLPGFTKRLTGLMPAVQAALAASRASSPDIRSKVSEAGAMARSNDFARAHTLLDEVEALLQTTPASTAPGQGLAAWQAARDVAIGVLKILEAAIRASEHEERDAAIMLVRAVRSNLTAVPDTPQKVDALTSYLTTDDIVDAVETPNVFGISVALRKPLLAALEAVKDDLARGGASLT